MSFLDKAKGALNQAKGKASDLAGQHGDKIDNAISKGGNFVDQRTKGKYADKIDKAQGAARTAADRFAAQNPAAPGREAPTAVPDPNAPVPPVPPVTMPGAVADDTPAATHPTVRPIDDDGPSHV